VLLVGFIIRINPCPC